MWPSAALLVVTLAAAPRGERVLVCRPGVSGDPALARGEALTEAVREDEGRLLDYGVPCESTAEAARAARRVGFPHAVVAAAEGRTEGSVFVLTVVDAEERVVAVRRVMVPPGSEPVRTLSGALGSLVAELPRPEGPRRRRRAALAVAGGGLALLVAGVLVAARARGDADRANDATTPAGFLEARRAWERDRAWSGAALGLGGAALAAGLVWRFELGGED